MRTAFVNSGYDVGQSTQWTWTNPPVTTFVVHDQRDRVLLVLVYPDASTAHMAHMHAEARQQPEQPQTSFDEGFGPALIPGYGASVWNQNVAILQSDLDSGQVFPAFFNLT